MSDLSDAVEVAKVAGQLLPQTMATVDSVVSSVVGVFELLMYPIKKANIEFKYKLEQFALDLQGKIKARKKRRNYRASDRDRWASIRGDALYDRQ